MDSLQEDVAAALDTLKEREREVIKMYFGISHSYALTLKEIGEEYGLPYRNGDPEPQNLTNS